jgi:hypothetical protein
MGTMFILEGEFSLVKNKTTLDIFLDIKISDWFLNSPKHFSVTFVAKGLSSFKIQTSVFLLADKTWKIKI